MNMPQLTEEQVRNFAALAFQKLRDERAKKINEIVAALETVSLKNRELFKVAFELFDGKFAIESPDALLDTVRMECIWKKTRSPFDYDNSLESWIKQSVFPKTLPDSFFEIYAKLSPLQQETLLRFKDKKGNLLLHVSEQKERLLKNLNPVLAFKLLAPERLHPSAIDAPKDPGGSSASRNNNNANGETPLELMNLPEKLKFYNFIKTSGTDRLSALIDGLFTFADIAALPKSQQYDVFVSIERPSTRHKKIRETMMHLKPSTDFVLSDEQILKLTNDMELRQRIELWNSIWLGAWNNRPGGEKLLEAKRLPEPLFWQEFGSIPRKGIPADFQPRYDAVARKYSPSTKPTIVPPAALTRSPFQKSAFGPEIQKQKGSV